MRKSVYKQEYPVVPENSVSLPKNGKKVLMIGAGLSGLIAGCELLDRGFDVTILEKNARAGGRIISWRDKTFGTPSKDLNWKGHPLEYSTHGVAGFYKNLREFLGRRGISLVRRRINFPGSILAFAYPDGRVIDIPVSQMPAPMHGFALLKGLKKLNSAGGERLSLSKLISWVAFDSANADEVDYLDSVTLEQWARGIGFSKEFVASAMNPITEMANFHIGEKTSALFWHQAHASILGHWKDVFNWQLFPVSTDETLIQPLINYIFKMGGKIIFNAKVDRFSLNNNVITGVVTEPLSDRDYHCPVCGRTHSSLPEGCNRCNYVGSDFVNKNVDAQELSADYYLLGVDIPGAKKIFSKEPFASNAFFQPAQTLPTSSVFIVYLWYPRLTGRGGVKSNWAEHFGGREIVLTGNMEVGPIINVSLTRSESLQGFDADVLEIDIARPERLAGLSDQEICDLADRSLRDLIPELPQYTDFRIMKWNNFSTMTVGAEKNRPSMVTPYKNFLILGDYIALKHNAMYMEKVAVVAKLAVNHLLDLEGQKEGHIKILKSETPNLFVSAMRKLFSVKPSHRKSI